MTAMPLHTAVMLAQAGIQHHQSHALDARLRGQDGPLRHRPVERAERGLRANLKETPHG